MENKGKAVLTSASLENLNEQAESSWNSSSSSISEVSSPGSDDSSVTITPDSISSSKITNVLINTSNWRGKFTDEVNTKINFIESSLLNENESDISLKLSDYFAYLINEYNIEIQTYNFMKSNSKYTIADLNNMKESIYYFREWISEYQLKIFPTSTVTIELGTINDSPKILTKNIV